MRSVSGGGRHGHPTENREGRGKRCVNSRQGRDLGCERRALPPGPVTGRVRARRSFASLSIGMTPAYMEARTRTRLSPSGSGRPLTNFTCERLA
jgi:hypothetical protein